MQRRINGHHRLLLPRSAVVTPLAVEQLREQGVEWRHEEDEAAAAGCWGFAQDRSYPLVSSAVRTLARDGLHFRELAGAEG